MENTTLITYLFDSITNDDITRLQQIITQFPELINAYSHYTPRLGAEQNTPLIFAAQLGRANMVQLLLEHGADVHMKTTGCCEYDALHAAIQSESPSLEVIKLLLEAGSDPNSSNECLYASSLSLAAQLGNSAVVQCLIAHGAIVKLLLKHGADPSLTNVDNETALMKAMKKGHESVALLLKETQ